MLQISALLLIVQMLSFQVTNVSGDGNITTLFVNTTTLASNDMSNVTTAEVTSASIITTSNVTTAEFSSAGYSTESLIYVSKQLTAAPSTSAGVGASNLTTEVLSTPLTVAGLRTGSQAAEVLSTSPTSVGAGSNVQTTVPSTIFFPPEALTSSSSAFPAATAASDASASFSTSKSSSTVSTAAAAAAASNVSAIDSTPTSSSASSSTVSTVAAASNTSAIDSTSAPSSASSSTVSTAPATTAITTVGVDNVATSAVSASVTTVVTTPVISTTGAGTTAVITTAPVPAPGTPSDVTLIRINSTALNVSWSLSTNQTGLYYNLSCSNRSGSTFSTNATYPYYVLGDLTPGTDYSCTVKACVLSVLCSVESNSTTGYTSPAKPSNVQIFGRTADSISVKWDQYGSVSYFNIAVNDNEPLVTNVPSVTIGNLSVAGGSYHIQITAFSNGLSSDVQTIDSVTDPPPPGDLSCNSSFGGDLKVFISRPLEARAIYNISNYLVISRPYATDSSCGTPDTTLQYDSAAVSSLRCKPGVSYSIEVLSVAADGNTTSSKPLSRNCTAAPGLVTNVSAVASFTNVDVSWKAPDGIYDGFLLSCLSSVDGARSVGNVSISRGTDQTTYNGSCSNLTAGVAYSVTVVSIANSVDSERVSQSVYTMPLSLPAENIMALSTDEAITLNLNYPFSASQSQCSQFIVQIVAPIGATGNAPVTVPYSSPTVELNGLVSSTRYSINITTQSFNVSSGVTTQKEVWTVPTTVKLSATPTIDSLTIFWNVGGGGGGILGYRLRIKSSNATVASVICVVCPNQVLRSPCDTIYQPTDCRESSNISYTVKGLTPATVYSVDVVAVNPGGESESSSQTYQTLQIPAEPTPACNGGCVAGIVIGIIVALILVVLAIFAFVYWRRKHPPAKPTKRSSYNEGIRNPTFMSDLYHADEYIATPPSPVRISDFVHHVQELHKDSDYKFAAEYSLLRQLTRNYPFTAAQLSQNRVKNRFTNILPYDRSRVKLIPLDDEDEGSDYINANYVPGYFSKREFIATQGPMKSTLDDFWRMIWEQNITSIVMLTNLQEKMKEKCECYWPVEPEPRCYGDVQVQLKSESALGHYVIRVMEIRVDEKKRIVKQMHFNTWPDFGCPKEPSHLLDFVQSVRSHVSNARTGLSGPILIHCSAGVGRSGTFIAVDRLLQQMRREDTIDVFGTVLEMRDYRCHMVQTEGQYIFAHDCLVAAIERGVHLGNPLNGHAFPEDDELYANAPAIKAAARQSDTYVNQPLFATAPEGDSGDPFDGAVPSRSSHSSFTASKPSSLLPKPAPRARNRGRMDMDPQTSDLSASSKELSLMEL